MIEFELKHPTISIPTLVRKLAESAYASDEAINFLITPDTPPFTDLFVLGRFLALFTDLTRNKGRKIRLSFRSNRRLESLEQLGFFAFCKERDIICDLPSGHGKQLPLMDTRPLRNYWRCLVPLSVRPIEDDRSEDAVYRSSQEILDGLSDEITTAFGDHWPDTPLPTAEITRLVFTAMKELLTNAIGHSDSRELIVAVSAERSTDPRSHQWSAESRLIDRYETLVMDVGRGVMPSILTTLGLPPVAESYSELMYLQGTFREIRSREESLLANIFRGNLVIRKGRQSEGLHELGQALTWFDGNLKLRSGRTEVTLDATRSEEPIPAIRDFRTASYFLPGTIIALSLPSKALRSAALAAGRESQKEITQRFRLASFVHVPKGLFGGVAPVNIL